MSAALKNLLGDEDIHIVARDVEGRRGAFSPGRRVPANDVFSVHAQWRLNLQDAGSTGIGVKIPSWNSMDLAAV